MFRGGIGMPLRLSSRTEPLPEMYLRQSTDALSTSSNRLRAKKSERSL
jgi:hypothetical protein